MSTHCSRIHHPATLLPFPPCCCYSLALSVCRYLVCHAAADGYCFVPSARSDHIGIDDGWQACGSGVDGSFHSATGEVLINETLFPDMLKMTQFAHAKKVHMGWYMNNCWCHQQELLAWNKTDGLGGHPGIGMTFNDLFVMPPSSTACVCARVRVGVRLFLAS